MHDDLYKNRKNKTLLWQIKVGLLFGKGLGDYVREWTNKSLLGDGTILFLDLGGGQPKYFLCGYLLNCIFTEGGSSIYLVVFYTSKNKTSSVIHQKPPWITMTLYQIRLTLDIHTYSRTDLTVLVDNNLHRDSWNNQRYK